MNAILGGATTAVGAVKSTTGTVTLNVGPDLHRRNDRHQRHPVVAGFVAQPRRPDHRQRGDGHPVARRNTAFASGTLTVAGGGTVNGTGTTVVTSTGTFELQQGTVNVVLAGTGIVANKTTSGTVTLNKVNTYTGATNIQAGTLQLGVANAVPTGSAVVLGTATTAGILDLNNLSQTVTSIAVSGTAGQQGHQQRRVHDAADAHHQQRRRATRMPASSAAAPSAAPAMRSTSSRPAPAFCSCRATTPSPAPRTSIRARFNSATPMPSAPRRLPASVTTVAPTATLDLNGQTVDPTEIVNIGGGTGANARAGVAATAPSSTTAARPTAPSPSSSSSGAATIGGSRPLQHPQQRRRSYGYIHSGTSAAPTPGTSFNLMKVGAAEDVIGVTDDADLNNINVNAGKLTFETSNTAGNATGTIIGRAAPLSLCSPAAPHSNVKNVVLTSGSILLGDGTAGTIDILGDGTNTLTLNGTPTISPTPP